MSLALTVFTLVHVALSLAAIYSGFVVVRGMLWANRLDGWTAFFLATTVATSVTGLLFPVKHFLPSHGVGIISLLALLIAIVARYRRQLAGSWRWIYVVSAVLALYLNFFVLIVQAFLKVPTLKALAPTQTEAPFKITQLSTLAIFFGLCVIAAMRFRPQGTISATAPRPSARSI